MRRLWWLPMPVGLLVSFQGTADSSTWGLDVASDYDYESDEITVSEGAATLLGSGVMPFSRRTRAGCLGKGMPLHTAPGESPRLGSGAEAAR